MKLHVSKIKYIIAFMLVLCLAVPFMSHFASVYVMAAHTHACHDEEHKDDCAGTKECCKYCANTDRAKNPLYGYAECRLSATPVLDLMFLAVSFDFPCVPYISLVSLNVRINN